MGEGGGGGGKKVELSFCSLFNAATSEVDQTSSVSGFRSSDCPIKTTAVGNWVQQLVYGQVSLINETDSGSEESMVGVMSRCVSV